MLRFSRHFPRTNLHPDLAAPLLHWTAKKTRDKRVTYDRQVKGEKAVGKGSDAFDACRLSLFVPWNQGVCPLFGPPLNMDSPLVDRQGRFVHGFRQGGMGVAGACDILGAA